MSLVDTLANTTFGTALSSVTQTAALTLGADSRTQATAFLIVASSVTSGATFQLEAKGGGSPAGAADNWIPITKFAITADGSYAIPVTARTRYPLAPDTSYRVKCVARTDGSYACSLSKLTKA